MFSSIKINKKKAFRRVVGLAGPTGCGKSSFLDDPYRYVSADDFPEHLSEAVVHAPHYREIRNLTQSENPQPDTVWAHIDIFNVLNGHRSRPVTELLQMITPELVAKWAPLSLLRDVEELHLVTMLVSRPVACSRFINREVENGRDRNKLLQKNPYTFGEESETFYRQLYESWYSFSQSLGAKSTWTLHGDTTPYKLVAGGDYSLSEQRC